jgi:5-methylcytosine-specific restriction enzyme A
MSWGFEIGRVYSRQVDIHARFGGQQQGGIITSAKHSLVIIVTGEEGLQHGYADRYRADGVFEYYGEGQVGDMQLHKGNRAIAQHSADGKSLLLFRQTRAGLRFECEMICEVHHVQRAPDRTGTERDALVFELRALDAVAEIVDAEPATPDASMKELQQRAFAQQVHRRSHHRMAKEMFTNAVETCASMCWPAPLGNAKLAQRPRRFCALTARRTWNHTIFDV